MAAEKGAQSEPVATANKSLEERFSEGQACLKHADTTCAQVALAGINPASPYAKILEAQIALQRQDFDSVLRLLLPLQPESDLPPAATGSLHATLALAYDSQGNPLRALEQRCLAEPYLASQEEVTANQQQILRTLLALSKDTLLEMRGESSDTLQQGWIDLALAAAHSEDRNSALAQWRSAYPDHPADEALLQNLTQNVPATVNSNVIGGKIALLLPIDTPTFAFAADGVRTGFMAAMSADKSNAQITVYPTHGIADEIPALYAQAVADGAKYIVGPLTRAEVAGLESVQQSDLTTIALNTLDDDASAPENLIQFGLPLEDEADQLARHARTQGMQTTIIVAANSPLAQRMAQAFAAAWTDQGGVVALQTDLASAPNLLDLRSQIASEPADMIFLAADDAEARQIRPYLDPAIPTFGLSHIYDGIANNPENGILNAIHFVDMPWLLNPGAPEFAPYRKAAAALPQGMAQRWFAVGVDAWRVLSWLIDKPTEPLRFRGLTGTITLHDNHIERELPLAQFRSTGVALE